MTLRVLPPDEAKRKAREKVAAWKRQKELKALEEARLPPEEIIAKPSRNIARAADRTEGGSERRILSSDEKELLQAAKKGHVDTLRKLLRKGVDANTSDRNGNTPLMLAVKSGNEECVESLLYKGADINATDMSGLSALSKAVIKGTRKIIDMLIQNGADLDAEDRHGCTPLSRAVRKGDWQGVQTLSEAGARLDPREFNAVLRSAPIGSQGRIAEILSRYGPKKW